MAELVFKGGTVYDGTGRAGFVADVAVDQGRIVAIGPDLGGEKSLDCRGQAVCPGFIDTHSHSDLMALHAPDLPMKVRQGVTTEIFGQDGLSVAPVRPADRAQVRRQLAGLDGDPPLEWSWSGVAEYLRALEQARPAVNVAYLVPHGALRLWAMGMADRLPSAAELQTMRELLDRALNEGAVGLSSGLIYPPCCYADTAELVALNEIVGEHRSRFVIHIRSESDRILEALDEVLEVGRQTGAHIHVSHFKIAGQNNWHKLEALLSRMTTASADQYPYIAGSTMFGAILPPWAHAGGVDKTLERLSDPAQRARMRAEMASLEDANWDNFWKWSGPEGILIADIPSGRHADLVGLSVAQAATRRQVDPFDLAFDLLRDEEMGVAMVSFSQSEEVVEAILRLPNANLCTDGLLGGRPHPRAYGSYPRVLGRYVRERQILSLEEAVRKMTSQAAWTFGLADRGELAVGKAADIVVFDPATVADTATFADPIQYPVGIPHVAVNGRLVVRSGEPTQARPGQVLRGRDAG